MTKDEYLLLKNEINKQYFESRNLLQKQLIDNGEFKVGDKVKVYWESRDYGKESSLAIINHIGIYKGNYKYSFRRIKKDGTMSWWSVHLPKYTKIIKIIKL